MSIAINTIILFFLFLLPGLLFRRGYYSKSFSKQFIKSSSLDIFMSSIIPGVVIQIIYTLLLNKYWLSIDFEAVINLTSSDSSKFTSGAEVLINSFSNVALFFLIQVFLSWILGRFCKTMVRAFKFDIRYKLFRYRNKWHYILRGEIIHFPENHLNNEVENIDATWVDVLSNIDSKTILYSGLLSDYHLTDQGRGLDHLELISVRKKEVDADITRPVSSSTLIIPYDKVLNINLTYVEDSDKKNSRDIAHRKFRKRKNNLLAILILIAFPFFFFIQFDLDIDMYISYFEKGIPYKILSYSLFIHMTGLFMTVEEKGEYVKKERWSWVLSSIILIFLIWLLFFQL